jgi:hypothetical protein
MKLFLVSSLAGLVEILLEINLLKSICRDFISSPPNIFCEKAISKNVKLLDNSPWLSALQRERKLDCG